MMTQWVEYLADIAVEEDEFLEEESSSEGEETSWRFMKNNEANVELQDDVFDLKLLRILKEQMEVIFGCILSKINTQKDIMNEVVRIFLDPVLNSWTAAANAGRNENTPLLSQQHICEFIRTLAYLSTYKETPTEFFASVDHYPASVECSKVVFKKVLNGFSNGEQESKWFEAHRTCAGIIECKKMCNTVNAQNAYIPHATILWKEDDQYCLRSKKCEDIDLVHVNNPKKAAKFMRWCQNDMPEDMKFLIPLLGICAQSDSPVQHTGVEFNAKTVTQLKELLRSKGLPISGSKTALVQRILDLENDELDIKDLLMQMWFMTPLKKGTVSKLD